MKAAELVSKVQSYAKEHTVPASKACTALNLNPRTYYASVQRLKTKRGEVKRAKQPVAAAKRAVSPRPDTISNVVHFPLSKKQTFLVVGNAASVAEVARALGQQ